MSIDSKHPSWSERIIDWEQMFDTHAGQRKIKEGRTKYLPATTGQEADGMNIGQIGRIAYEQYLKRAPFPNLVKDAVDNMVGIMHREPARIELPARLEGMRENATVSGESLQTLLRKINESQLKFGRIGLLLEAPSGLGPDALPFIAAYNPVTIINWDDGVRDQGRQTLEMVVLNESENERTSMFEWEIEVKHRVLLMSNQLGATNEVMEAQGILQGQGVYVAALIRDGRTSISPSDFMMPQIAGRPMERIPFVFINTRDLIPTPDDPPLLGLSNLALTIYRGEADYRQSLYMQGQETFVTIGADEPEKRLGAGAFMELPKGADAKYVGVGAEGLTEQREALEDDRARAGEQTSKLFEDDGQGAQSGKALNVRMSGKTANLSNIARTGAEGLANILRMAAEWVGANPDEVVVEPNTDFKEDALTGLEMLNMQKAKQSGFPLSQKSLHRIARRRDMTEMEFDEEMEEIENEEPLGGDGLGVEDENLPDQTADDANNE